MASKKTTRKKSRVKNQEAKLRIEKSEVLKEVPIKSFEVVRISRVKYFENPFIFVDIRVFRRGYDSKGDEVFFPTLKGVQIKETDFGKLMDAHFLDYLDKQIGMDPR